MAAARVGVAYASTEIISIFNKVKPPYNVSALNQIAALDALQNYSEFEKRKTIILEQKKWLEKQFLKIASIKKVYPSDANFILIETTNADKIYSDLVNKKIIIRNRNSLVRNCIRITVGSPAENEKLVNALIEISK